MKNIFLTCMFVAGLTQARVQAMEIPKVSKFAKIISLLEGAMHGTLQFEEQHTFCKYYLNNQPMRVSNKKIPRFVVIAATCLITENYEEMPDDAVIKAKLSLLPQSKNDVSNQNPYQILSELDILQIQVKRFFDLKHTCYDQDAIDLQLGQFKASNSKTFNALFGDSVQKAVMYFIKWQEVCEMLTFDGELCNFKQLNECMNALKEFPVQPLEDALQLFLQENPGFGKHKPSYFVGPTHSYDGY